MRKVTVIFSIIVLTLICTGCKSDTEENHVNSRSDNLKAIYNEFTKEYEIEDYAYRLSPDNTGEVMRYVASTDIEFNDRNTEILRNNVKVIYSCMKKMKITSLYAMNENQWTVLKEQMYYFSECLGLNTEYEAGTGICFTDDTGNSVFVMAELDSRNINRHPEYYYNPYYPYSPYYYSYR